MKKINLLILIAVSILFITSCEPTIDNPIGTGSLGSLSTNKDSLVYVAIGNSITAGYMDGAVYSEGQKYSFPNLLATQLGITNFIQPGIEGEGLGMRFKFKGFTSTGSPILDKLILPEINVSNASYPKPFNNLGVPAAIVYDLIDTVEFAQKTYALKNPFYFAVLRFGDKYGKSIIDQAIKLKPSLITLEMGANDVLLYATTGGTMSTTQVGGKYVPTPATALLGLYQAALTKLTQALPNTKILLFTVPEVTNVPFFKTVPWNALVLTDTLQVKGLNAAYSGLFKFNLGANGFIAADPYSQYKMRQLKAGDAVLLQVPQDSLAKFYMGSKYPIPKQYVLFGDEIDTVKKAVSDYNEKIRTLTSISQNIKIFDLDDVFVKLLSSGYPVPGSTTLNASYIAGELFSTDGIHPTPRGYGVIANELIKFINTNYGSDIPHVRLQNLPAITVYK
ncbi:MAG: hypothetical protein HW421_2024 [Ignavibacteria bacterium]|nr:hypothetical protein [Ignavibacteria bacterium]